ncbi:MAG: hypothetical protein KG003_05820 [Bacteroidetes bacterium]|nr:hypothetical protein [Bacteroidota bacterium]
MQKALHFIPIITTLFSAYFFSILWKHWRSKPDSYHIMWWMIGVFFYGLGTITESVNTLAGYSDFNFRAWYIFGALLGGAPLAQGTVYLLMKRKTAHILTAILVSVIGITSILVILSPLHPEFMDGMRMSGKLLDWKFIRFITPFINIYGVIFLAGGAVYSAIKYAKNPEYKSRFLGNLAIALGSILPAIGGSFTKFGYVEVLYVTELLGLICIYTGYKIIRNDIYHLNKAN